MTSDMTIAAQEGLSRRGAVEVALAATLGVTAQAAPSRPAGARQADPTAARPEAVRVGLDGWLFLAGGSNETIRYYTEPDFLDRARVQGWIDRLGRRGQEVERRGGRYLHLFSPDKISIYGEFFGETLAYFGRRPNAVLLDALGKAGLDRLFLNAETALLEQKPHAQQYPKTDTHWTADGAYTVYAAICARLGIAPTFTLRDRPYEERTSTGDLGSKLTPPVREASRRYHILRDARRVHANGLVEEGERRGGAYPSGLLGGSHVIYRNDAPAAHDARLMLFGDSYSGIFPGHGLTMMMAETFREVHFLWSNSVDARLVERHRPDIVVSELAERFARILPNDDRDIAAAAAERLRSYRAGQAGAPAR